MNELQDDRQDQSAFDVDVERLSDSEEELKALPTPPRAPVHHTDGETWDQAQDDAEAEAREREGDLSSTLSLGQKGETGEDRQEVPTGPSVAVAERKFEGCSQISNYLIQQKIGAGTFGDVSLGIDQREIRILKRMNHPNVVKLLEIAIRSGKKEQKHMDTYMVFPYLEHDLDGLLQNPAVILSIPQVKSYMQQLLRGLEHLHKNNILHRDIKCANLLISNKGYLKIADFGLARPFNPKGGRYTNDVITRWYRPPELLLGATEYDGAVDIWGVGCVFGEILRRRALFPGDRYALRVLTASELKQLELIWNLCGTPNEKNWPGKGYLKLPLFAQNVLSDFDETTKRDPTFKDIFPKRHFTDECYALLRALLQLCPAERVTATEALTFPYFTREPLPAVPGTADFSPLKDSHELDSRNAHKNRHGKAPHLAMHYDQVPGSFAHAKRKPEESGHASNARSLKPFRTQPEESSDPRRKPTAVLDFVPHA
ncbi:serine/threonine protein kinase, CMGC, CDC2/CDK sub [Kappamyces sp. JEL0680]|nr:serine/threonine protein kinase, CMGC, CDC2/CDK sub [Kappamyces sp. JEL0680]